MLKNGSKKQRNHPSKSIWDAFDGVVGNTENRYEKTNKGEGNRESLDQGIPQFSDSRQGSHSDLGGERGEPRLSHIEGDSIAGKRAQSFSDGRPWQNGGVLKAQGGGRAEKRADWISKNPKLIPGHALSAEST